MYCFIECYDALEISKSYVLTNLVRREFQLEISRWNCEAFWQLQI